MWVIIIVFRRRDWIIVWVSVNVRSTLVFSLTGSNGKYIPRHDGSSGQREAIYVEVFKSRLFD